MANGIFNIAKGSYVGWIRDDPTNIGVMLLKEVESDTDLRNRNSLAAILAESGNTECDFTNYARITGITGTINVDNALNRVSTDIPDQTWMDAGGATNNDIVKLIVYYQFASNDNDRLPISFHDYVITTTGGHLTAQIAADGFSRTTGV